MCEDGKNLTPNSYSPAPRFVLLKFAERDEVRHQHAEEMSEEQEQHADADTQ